MANKIEFTIVGKDSFSNAFKSVGKSVEATRKAVTSFTKIAIGATTAVVGFTAVVANGEDKFAKFSTRTGVAVDELTSLSFAANQAGISAEQFNMATQRMTRRVSEAAKGFGEAKSALNELNIDAARFKNLGLEDQYAELADAMEKVKDPSDKLRLAFKLFDSEGTAVIQMLDQGSEAMRKAADDARFLGVVVGQQAAADSEHFTDSMGRATASMKGVSRAIAHELMPVLSGLANRFADTLAENRQSIVDFTKSAITNFFTVVDVVRQVFAKIKEAFSSGEAFTTFASNVGQLVVYVGSAFIALGKSMAVGVWEGVKAATGILNDFGSWLGGALHAIMTGGEVQSFGSAIAESLDRNIGAAVENMRAEISDTLGILEMTASQAAEVITEDLGISITAANENAKTLISQIAEFGTVTKDQITETAAMMSETMLYFQEQSNAWMDGLKNSNLEFVDTLFKTANNTINSISQAMAASIMQGKNLLQSFKEIGKAVIQELIASLIKLGIQRLLFSALSKGAVAAEASSEAGKAVGLAGANMFASMAGAPFPINLAAPAAAAAATAGAAASFSTGLGLGKAMGASAIAHGGMTNVPSESTYLLDKGERVLSPNQNRDFTDFLKNGGGSGGGGNSFVIENIEIRVLENATSADALLNMDSVEVERIVAGPIIDALNSLDRHGVRPVFAERERS